jgi:hypothetical protein
MHLNVVRMASKRLCRSVAFLSIRRYASGAQDTAAERATARSFLVRFIEDRRKRSQQDDIRLEPYISKGVYTESGAIRPVSNDMRSCSCTSSYLDAKAIPSRNRQSSPNRYSLSVHWHVREQIRSIRLGEDGLVRLQ